MSNPCYCYICRYLLDHGADVAAVNNEGELPLDLAEEEDMEDLLTDEIERLGELLFYLGHTNWDLRTIKLISITPVMLSFDFYGILNNYYLILLDL